MAKRRAKKSAKAPTRSVGGPFIRTAVICEKVLVEGDGVRSLVRMLDTIIITGEAHSLPPGLLKFFMIVEFKSGDAKGKKTVSIRCSSPSGDASFSSDNDVDFQGGEQGPLVQAEVLFGLKESGIYWFSVLLDKRLITKIPLKISYQRAQSA